MLFKYNKKNRQLAHLEETDFASHKIMERQDIEKWVEDNPDILGEELLIITTEYDKFDKTKERLDLLALDKNGKLVIVELKRDDSGKYVELQAIKYAAYCSTLTLDQITASRKEYLSKKKGTISEDEIKNEITDFIRMEDFEKIDDKPRIILVSKEFRSEVTASVLWLRKFGVDISCIKLTPYKIDDENIGLVSTKIIPLPEAEEYQIKVEEKEGKEGGLTRTQEEYLDFYRELSKKLGEELDIDLLEPKPQSNFQVSTDISGIHFEWAFHGRPRSSFGVELHFEKGNKTENLRYINALREFKNELEGELGEEIIFQQDWGNRWARLYVEKEEGKMTDELKTWAIEKMTKMYNFLQPKLEEIRK